MSALDRILHALGIASSGTSLAAEGGPGSLDLGMLVTIFGGCGLAWVLAYVGARLMRLPRSRGGETPPIRVCRARVLVSILRLDEVIAAFGNVVMLGLLGLSADAVARAGETMMMSTAAALAILATPMTVVLLEQVHAPRAESAAAEAVRRCEEASAPIASGVGLQRAA